MNVARWTLLLLSISLVNYEYNVILNNVVEAAPTSDPYR
jgi:hypothetical protein